MASGDLPLGVNSRVVRLHKGRRTTFTINQQPSRCCLFFLGIAVSRFRNALYDRRARPANRFLHRNEFTSLRIAADLGRLRLAHRKVSSRALRADGRVVHPLFVTGAKLALTGEGRQALVCDGLLLGVRRGWLRVDPTYSQHIDYAGKRGCHC